MKDSNGKVHTSYLLFIMLFYFFIFRDWLEQWVPFIGYGDELLALCAVPFFLFGQNQLQVKRRGYGKYVFLFLVSGLITSVIYMYQNFIRIALADAFLCLKFWLALYVGKELFANMDLKWFGKNIYQHVKFVIRLYLSFYIVDQILKVFPASIRYGMRSTQLMYSHPTVFVSCCIFLTMVLLSVRDYAPGYKKWLVALLLLICTTLRSKAFGAALVIILICYFVFYRKKQFGLRSMLLLLPLMIALGWEQIEYYFFSSIQSDSARYQLLVKSLEIAKDYFPLGTGFGTFASYYSGVEYSPVYRMYGLTNIHGLKQGATSFVSDSFWPMVLGQTGIVGMIGYVLAIIMLFKEIQSLCEINESYYAAALCGICYLLIASVAESAFVNPVAIPIAAMTGFLLAQKNFDSE